MKLLNPQLNLDSFFVALSKSASALLILDFDGTIAPFVEDPEAVQLYPGVAKRLEKIVKANHTRLVIMSGRALSSLSLHLKLSPMPELWGSHGGERLLAGSQQNIVHGCVNKMEPILAQAKEAARLLAPSLYCELKPLSIAIHYRNKQLDVLRGQIDQLYRDWAAIAKLHKLEIHEFDGGFELRKIGVNKGVAVKTLTEEMASGTVIAYLGDDMTDEEAFLSLKSSALKVLVRQTYRVTAADLQLIPPDELIWFLEEWIKRSG